MYNLEEPCTCTSCILICVGEIILFASKLYTNEIRHYTFSLVTLFYFQTIAQISNM